MIRTKASLLGFCLLAVVFLMPGICVPSSDIRNPPVSIEKPLPQSRLSYYGDSFDQFRKEIWKESELTYYERQLAFRFWRYITVVGDAQ